LGFLKFSFKNDEYQDIIQEFYQINDLKIIIVIV